MTQSTTQHVRGLPRTAPRKRAGGTMNYTPVSSLTSDDTGAPRGIRTPNLLIRSQMLYPLS